MKYAVIFVQVTLFHVIFHVHKFDADNVDKFHGKRSLILYM